MKKICVVTSTRAEYGVLKNTIQRIEEDADLELKLVVTGTHVVKEYGNTIDEIKKDGFPICEIIQIMEPEKGCTVIKTMSSALERFGKCFVSMRPDLLVVVGDRYEIMAICEAAMVLKIPIAHISGGEITEGAIDDTIRHCITKMSCLHFPACETYRKRIIQMGEAPETVFNYGDVGVENVYKMQYLSLEEIEKFLEFKLDTDYACVTYHPATLGKDTPENQINELLIAIDKFPDMKYIFTGANADEGGDVINNRIQKYVEKHHNCRYYNSLGIQRYLSLIKNCAMVIGNSSSGIIEAPCFGVPTVNIGNRQKGRLQAQSVLNCETDHKSIEMAICKARSEQFIQLAKKAKNPYGNGNTSEQIVREIKRFLSSGKGAQKKFYDINF